MHSSSIRATATRRSNAEPSLRRRDSRNRPSPTSIFPTSFGRTLQRRAMALYSLGRFDDAAAEIEQAYALDPGNAEICNNVGFVIQRLGRREEALAWCDRALE